MAQDAGLDGGGGLAQVLVVDDIELNRKLLAKMLTKRGELMTPTTHPHHHWVHGVPRRVASFGRGTPGTLLLWPGARI